MGNYNKIILLGRVGQEPKYSESANGIGVAKFSVATSRKVNNKEITQWHNVTVFKNTAKFVQQYVHKGDSVLVEGEMTYQTYKNKAGEDVRYAEVMATIVQIASQGKTQPSQPQNSDFPYGDDMPA